jgi:hypothetical protein
MKKILGSTLVWGILLGTAAIYADQPLRGVAGVEVTVKENPAKRIVTDSRGSFALQGLKPGSYTVIFKAQKAKDSKASTTGGPVTVAQTYSIKVEGTKKPVNLSAISDQLLKGLAVPVQVGAAAQIRGQVAATETQKMVWVAGELGSHIPGHWVPADSPEAKGHGARPTHWMKGQDVQNMTDGRDPFHQEGWGGSGR